MDKEKDGAQQAQPEAQGEQQPQIQTDTAEQAGDTGKPKQARGKRYLRRTLIALGLVLVVVVGAVFAGIHSLNNAISGENTEAGVLPEEVKTSAEEAELGIINLLVCGIDYDNEDANGYTTEDKIGRTDMILYIHYDTINNTANILQIPRDVYVGDEVQTGGTYKINGLYFFSEDEDNRMAALAQVLYDQYKLPTDAYITIDMDALKEIIDIMGSIAVYVPVDIEDPDPKNDSLILAGWRHFSGEEAEFFLRNRTSPTYHQQGDIKRLEMQQQFYSALFREFKQLSTSDLIMWMGVFVHRIKTDMDVLRIGSLAQKALGIEGADITFIRPACGGDDYNGWFVMSLDPEEMADILNEYFREGETYSAEELDIPTRPYNETYGMSETNIRSMSDIQEQEPEYE